MNKTLNMTSILFLSLLLSSCAYFNFDYEEDAEAPAADQSLQETPQVESLPNTTPAPLATAPAPLPAPIEFKNSIPADKALGWLKNGNTRYLTGRLRQDGQSKKDILRLTNTQAPHSIVLSCSDSRVPPEIVFDQKLGEIFTIRSLGYLADTTTITSIEYALTQLGTKHILVMGHTGCDGMSRNQDVWTASNRVINELAAKSKIISDRLLSGGVKMTAALYHLESGKVDFSR